MKNYTHIAYNFALHTSLSVIKAVTHICKIEVVHTWRERNPQSLRPRGEATQRELPALLPSNGAVGSRQHVVGGGSSG